MLATVWSLVWFLPWIGSKVECLYWLEIIAVNPFFINLCSNVKYNFTSSINAKVISLLYLLSGIFSGLIGFQISFIIRLSIKYGSIGLLATSSLSSILYQRLLTAHAFVMIFFAIMPILIGALGNLLFPLMLSKNKSSETLGLILLECLVLLLSNLYFVIQSLSISGINQFGCMNYYQSSSKSSNLSC